MPDPNLSISPLTDQDIPTYVSIRHETFIPTVNKVLYSRQPSPSPETFQGIAEGVRKGLNDGIIYLKCVDDSSGEMIAGARWQYLRSKVPSEEFDESGKVRRRPWEEVEDSLKIPEMYSESDERVWNGFFGGLAEGKRRVMGDRPYYVLDTLVTHPDHHRRGAGTLLTAWGCDRADEKGIEVYLEASPMGKPLYERFGFQEVGKVNVELGQFGWKDLEFILMRRPSKQEREAASR
ncbi:acyl-CoA N-acyltransferase [Lojkania enalia]|uniref:Acyl-CoA N-acyltransferase n=1 Tax=Lojkania enalia TaxID=147567 RepID=A0A9P4JW83_9PLEO|nr:acyl-CoA N-acyltransferase [Didymosphaeria enalia]